MSSQTIEIERKNEILLAVLAVLIRDDGILSLNSPEIEVKLRTFISCPELRKIRASFPEVKEIYKEACGITLKSRTGL